MKTPPGRTFVQGTLVLAALVVIAILSGCAGTDLYGRDGKRLARMQGDMTNVKYSMSQNGEMHFSADTVDHSSATIAAGKTSAGNIAAAGSILTTATLLK